MAWHTFHPRVLVFTLALMGIFITVNVLVWMIVISGPITLLGLPFSRDASAYPSWYGGLFWVMEGLISVFSMLMATRLTLNRKGAEDTKVSK